LSCYEDGRAGGRERGRERRREVVEVCSFLTLAGKKPSAAPSLIMDCSLAQTVTACVAIVESDTTAKHEIIS
jgi:hypothetical protein